MADLYGLSAADRDVLMRLIQRERANYSANVRSLAPVPRKKIEWKPSSSVVWIILTQPLYPSVSSGTNVNRATGYLTVYDEPNQWWEAITPTQEVTVEASSTNVAAPVGALIACQKHGDVYEAISGAPFEESIFTGFDGSKSGHGWTNFSGSNYGLRDTTSASRVTATGWLAPKKRLYRYYTNDIRANGIQFDNSAATPETNGNFICNHSGFYEVMIELSGTAGSAWTGASEDHPRQQQDEGETGPASAGTAHTHDFDYNYHYITAFEPIVIQPQLYRKEGAGAYAILSALNGKQFFAEDVRIQEQEGSGGNWKYTGHAFTNLLAGDRIGIAFYLSNLRAASVYLADMKLSFRPADLYTRLDTTAY